MICVLAVSTSDSCWACQLWVKKSDKCLCTVPSQWPTTLIRNRQCGSAKPELMQDKQRVAHVCRRVEQPRDSRTKCKLPRLPCADFPNFDRLFTVMFQVTPRFRR